LVVVNLELAQCPVGVARSRRRRNQMRMPSCIFSVQKISHFWKHMDRRESVSPRHFDNQARLKAPLSANLKKPRGGGLKKNLF
jgi:hypothetical protein